MSQKLILSNNFVWVKFQKRSRATYLRDCHFFIFLSKQIVLSVLKPILNVRTLVMFLKIFFFIFQRHAMHCLYNCIIFPEYLDFWVNVTDFIWFRSHEVFNFSILNNSLAHRKWWFMDCSNRGCRSTRELKMSFEC